MARRGAPSGPRRSPAEIKTDIEIGARIRERRLALGITQEGLAHDCGITFQQVQKYERGANRCSGSRLVRLADALQSTVSDLIGGPPARGPKPGDTKRMKINRYLQHLSGARLDALLALAKALKQEAH